jgi:hypothetical protein
MKGWLLLLGFLAANVPLAAAGRLEGLVVSEAVLAALVGRYWWTARRDDDRLDRR